MRETGSIKSLSERLPRFRPLAGLRIRRKLIVLHTVFSLALAAILILALRPAIAEVVREAEVHEARLVLKRVLSERANGEQGGWTNSRGGLQADDASIAVQFGGPASVGIDEAAADRARATGELVVFVPASGPAVVAAYEPATGQYVSVATTLTGARAAVIKLYIVMTVALLGVYALVAAALEIFVLPQHVYRPIRTLLEADAALRAGQKDKELIASSAIPADELGEIMRSRNESISELRRHERELAGALARLEEVATDLKRKNHLLEMARQNLADADRLASLGMMSAGLAHELNTPLTVLKGLTEKLNDSSSGGLRADEAALMLRVVARLEKLGESLLDFARARPSTARPAALRPIVEEAWTLVRLDRDAPDIDIEIDIPESLGASCDGDRILQVFVNILRNATDAMEPGSGHDLGRSARGRIRVSGAEAIREGEHWAVVTISDNGPGIDANVLSRLFQPFVSTRLDAKGSGLGLAVAEGIVREHGGVLLARNRSDASGAVFEIVLRHAVVESRSAGRPVVVNSGERLPGVAT